jgi:hypothetical protein
MQLYLRPCRRICANLARLSTGFKGRLTLPLSSPSNRAAFTPVRDNIGAEHVLPDSFGVHQRIPDFFAWGVDSYGSPGNQFLVHRWRLSTGLSF